MKNRLKHILFALILISNAAQAQWVDITPTDTAFGFGKIDFITPSIGYVAGNTHNQLQKTMDGGSTWNSISLDSTLVTDIHFVTPLVGYVSGNKVFPATKHNLSKTTDGGATWQPIAPVASTFSNVFFKDANTGFITENWGTTYKTTNGGVNWTKVDSSGNDMIDKGFYSTTSDTGYFAGWDGTFDYKGVINKTTDNGATWQSIAPFGTTFNNDIQVISSIHMVNQDTGFFVFGFSGSAHGTHIYKTVDGFATLDSIAKPTLNIYDIYFLSSTLGYLLADSGVYITTDGISFTKELSFTNGQGIGKFDRTGNKLFVTTGSRVYKRDIVLSVEDEMNWNKLDVYPNPATNSINIKSNYNGLVEIFDVSGKLTLSVNKMDRLVSVNISNLSNGVYFLKIGDTVKKLVVNSYP